MTSTTAQPSAQPATAQPAEPTFLLSGSAAECLRELRQRYPWLLHAQTMRELPAKLPAHKGYDFRNPRPLSEVLTRLCSDLKLPALAKVARDWRKLLAMPQAGIMTAAEWDAVLGSRAQLSFPGRFVEHNHALESWDSPWVQAEVQAERGSAFWGPARCCHCAVDGVSPTSGRMFYYPHGGDCEPQCSGLGGRCGSPLCNGACITCIRGRDPECNGVCGAGGPCLVFVEASPGSEDGVWVDPDALPAAQPDAKAEALSGGPCLEGAGNGEHADDRQDEPDAEQPIAQAEPPASPTKPALPAPKPIAPSLLQPTKQTATDDKDAKRLAQPLTQSPTVKPPVKRKPLDVAGALAALQK